MIKKIFLFFFVTLCSFLGAVEQKIGKLQNKVAVITGGAQGIGKAISETFANEGAIVVVVDIQENLGSGVVTAINAKGGKAFFIKGDVSNEQEVSHVFSEIVSRFKRVDIVVNNAAIAIYKRMEEYTSAEWNQIIGVNLNSIYYTARYSIPLMKKRGGGNIISISSVHARTTSTNNNPYVASKGAVVSLTRAMALEGAPDNIRVNCISPGAIETPMLMENWGNITVDQHPLLPRIPLKRIGSPFEIARVALFLVSDDSSYITGSEILVDGGLSAHFD